jgi:hypothetical protein
VLVNKVRSPYTPALVRLGQRCDARPSRLSGWVAFIVVIAVILSITTLPYALAYWSTPPGWQFMGILLNVPDTSQYLSWARESSRSFLIENKLTSEHGVAVYYNLFFFGVGQLASMLHIRYAEALQIIRLVAGAVYLAAIYWFTGLFFPQRFQRWTAALMAIVGGGLGWLLVIQKLASGEAEVAFPLDIYVTEANTFLSVLAFPLQAMAGGLVVLVLGLAAIAFERNSFRPALAAGLLALLLGSQHAYDLVVVYSVVGTVALLSLLRRGSWIRPLAIAICVCAWSLPTALWSLAITHFDPIWRGTLAQYGNAGVYTPPLPHLLILMGVPLLLTLVGLATNAPKARPSRFIALVRDAPMRDLLLLVWLLLGCALLYIPADFQIKMFVAWQVPLSIFATRTLFRGIDVLGGRVSSVRSPRAALIIAGIVVATTIPTNAYLLGWRVIDLSRHDYPYYLRTDEVAALHWLDANTPPGAAVLSSLTIGQYIPSEAGNNAFLAHWAETMDYYTKQRDVSLFFNASTSDSFRRALIDQYGIGYIFFGSPERELGSYDPTRSAFLEKVFSNSTVTIYGVSPRPLATVSHVSAQLRSSDR